MTILKANSSVSLLLGSLPLAFFLALRLRSLTIVSGRRIATKRHLNCCLYFTPTKTSISAKVLFFKNLAKSIFLGSDEVFKYITVFLLIRLR